LSSEQPGRDVLVTMYQSAAATRADLQRFYTSMLQERGYALLDSHDAMSEQLIIAKNERANQLITVAFAEDEAGKGIATLSTRPD
jgi:hypothetical protein